MRGFDVLDPALDLTRSYFLEASAGTGKTFTIENLIVRLLQTGIPIERILIVTFTRTATLELKMRIRARLEEKNLRSALAHFDEAQIFTIHGFCFHTLREHAFATGFSLAQTEESVSPDVQKNILKDFLRTELSEDEIHPRQLEKVLKKGRGSLEGFLQGLMKPITHKGRSYQEILQEVRRVIAELSIPDPTEEVLTYASRFRGMCDRRKQVKPDILSGIHRLSPLWRGESADLVDLPLMKMTPENLLNKQSYPTLLTTLNRRLIPLLEEASQGENILARLSGRAHQFVEHVCEKEDLFFYDDLLKQMHACTRQPAFAASVRAAYDAVLIDEFQDTDQKQWEIFSTLFLNHVPLFVVGDPKQSIYRFRGADLYAYMEAKKALGERAQATLTRNYRSEPTLISALNALFQKVPTLIALPQTGEAIPILPIEAARPSTGEGKIVICKAQDEAELFGFILDEIERLHTQFGIPYRQCAVLVKDRYQAQRFCAQCPLPFATKKSESLQESEAFAVLEDLLQAALTPRNKQYVLKALGGPLFGWTLEELAEGLGEKVEPFYRYHQLLTTQGIVAFFQNVCSEVTFPHERLFSDLWQLVEIIAEHTKGAEESLAYLQKLKLEDPESEILKARMQGDEDAIQVMTLHVSKGLEFEAVFPVGLMKESAMHDPEDFSEKMRQLYVACTRAKKYLYLPYSDDESLPIGAFFNRVLSGTPIDHFVSANPHFALVTCPTLTTRARARERARARPLPEPLALPTFPPLGIFSYTALTPHTDYEGLISVPENVMPAGVETGILLHRIFERLDFSLRDESLRTFLTHELRGTSLAPWLTTIEEMILNTLYATLPAPSGNFCLADVNPAKIVRELEFLYASDTPSGYMKGFIDLFFEHQGHYYCIDWKSNYLEAYTAEHIASAVAHHHYNLQAQIYQTALQKYLALHNVENQFEACFYLFLRGLQSGSTVGIYLKTII